MACLLIPCVGPMQAWGTRSRFQERDTEREPTKSGIIGLVASAFGRKRDDPIDDLRTLTMAVRVDREGVLKREFQTAQDVAQAGGGKSSLISFREWLADAVFLVSLKGDKRLLQKVHDAIRNPARPLFLGRKSFLPSRPLFEPTGLVQEADIRRSLFRFPLIENTKENITIRFVLPDDGSSGETRMDEPLSFSINNRQYRLRYVRTEFIPSDRIGKELNHVLE